MTTFHSKHKEMKKTCSSCQYLKTNRDIGAVCNLECTHPVAGGCTSFLTVSDSMRWGCNMHREKNGSIRVDDTEVVEFIGSIRDIFGTPDTANAYEHSLRFARLLKHVYPAAKLRRDEDMVYAVISGVAYDIYGSADVDISQMEKLT